MALRRLIVVGAGAVGGGIGGLLTEAKLPTVLVARGDHGRKIRDNGLCVRMPNRTLTVGAECVEYIDEVDWRDGDVAMIATKLTDAQAVMDELVAAAGPDLPVVCASNGIHGERWASERFTTVVSMLLWLPATHLEPGEVRLYSGTCLGVLDNGPICGNDAAEVSVQLCEWLRQVGFDAVARDDIQRWKHAKWITNLGNAAQALVTDDWKTIARMTKAEGEAVLEKAGLPRVTAEEFKDRTAHVRLEPIDGKPRLGGSTWQSFHRGTPMESRWLEGAMADVGDQVGVPTPVNRFLSDVSEDPRPLTASMVLDAIAE